MAALTASGGRGDGSGALGGALLLEGVSFALGLTAHVFLSRWLGSEDYGDISVVLSAASLGTTIALLGFGRAAPSTLGGYGAEGRADLTAGFLRYGVLSIVVSGTALSLLGLGVLAAARRWFGVGEHPVGFAAALILPMAIATFLEKCLGGMRHPLLPLVFGQCLGGAVLVAILGIVLYFLAAPPSESLAVGALLASWLVPLGVLAVVLIRLRPRVPAAYRRAEWRSRALHFMSAALPIVAVERSGVILLELLHSDEAAVGIFAAAHQTATLPLIVLAAVRQLAEPELAAAARVGPARTAAVLRRYVPFLTAAGLLAWILFLAFGDEFLRLFGHDTEGGHKILILLGFGYLILMLTGLVTMVLQIHGDHQLVTRSMTAQLGLTVGLGVLAVPRWGGEGFAAAYALSILLVHGALSHQVGRRLGISYLASLAWWRGAREPGREAE